MALKSMTGFARSDGRHGALSWHWEIRTVNGRGLDMRLRLPPGFEAMEPLARAACKDRLARGNCQLNLSIQRDAGTTTLRLNEAALEQVVAAVQRAGGLIEAEPPTLDGLLAIRGVLEHVDAEDDTGEAEAQSEAILADLEAALERVVAARSSEGEHLSAVIAEQIDEIERLTGEIERAPARTPDAIRTRLEEQVQRVLEATPQMDEQRLHQEAVLLAAKVDVEEELKRLKAHIAAARDLLGADAPAGRRLEFLTQEFMREANTICSKSNDTEITNAGLALKAAVDRMREQVQNIE